ncbi:MAG TPA: hypothetical protein VHF22_10200, partial [Planctomycetota bacterium]|nr:hypothetical protein [Planctomycetota bacterium]
MNRAVAAALFLGAAASFPLAAATAGEPGADERAEAALERRAAALRVRADLEGFTVVVEPPFVVVGDGAPEAVRGHAAGIVRWAVKLLKARYFEKDPDERIEIWLFKDKESYESHVRAFWKTAPSTPFGYYSPEHHALVMNIATGGGTLVHEIVHPFVRANFPACPAWFNEGLASLYEQCQERDGAIRGLTNWRLAGLQQAIRAGALPSFERLATEGDAAFYEDATGYAQARYLCYYLQ